MKVVGQGGTSESGCLKYILFFGWFPLRKSELSSERCPVLQPLHEKWKRKKLWGRT